MASINPRATVLPRGLGLRLARTFASRQAMGWLRNTSSTGWRACLVQALLIAVVVRALLPVGFMTGIGADGRLTMVICSSAAAGGLTVATAGDALPLIDHGENTDAVGLEGHAPCVFAGMPTLPAPIADALLVMPPPRLDGVMALPREATLLPQPTRPPLGARGPPALT